MNPLLLLLIPALAFSSVVVPSREAPQLSGYVAEFEPGWLIAHNNRDGETWPQIRIGDEIVYDGAMYTVFQIEAYRALEPLSPKSLMQDTYDGQVYRAQAVLDMVRCEDCITLMTCINNGQDPSWGRLFITARSKK